MKITAMAKVVGRSNLENAAPDGTPITRKVLVVVTDQPSREATLGIRQSRFDIVTSDKEQFAAFDAIKIGDVLRVTIETE